MSHSTELFAVGSVAVGILLCASETVAGVALGLPAAAFASTLVVASVGDRLQRYDGKTGSDRGRSP